MLLVRFMIVAGHKGPGMPSGGHFHFLVFLLYASARADCLEEPELIELP
jgi:hypothetical protein